MSGMVVMMMEEEEKERGRRGGSLVSGCRKPVTFTLVEKFSNIYETVRWSTRAAIRVRGPEDGVGAD